MSPHFLNMRCIQMRLLITVPSGGGDIAEKNAGVKEGRILLT